MGSRPSPPHSRMLGKGRDRGRRDRQTDRPTDIHKKTKGEPCTYTLGTRLTHRETRAEKDGRTEDIKTEIPKTQTRVRRRKEKEGGKGRRDG